MDLFAVSVFLRIQMTSPSLCPAKITLHRELYRGIQSDGRKGQSACSSVPEQESRFRPVSSDNGRKVRLRMALPTELSKERRKECFLCSVAILKEYVWKTRMKGITTGTIISGVGLLLYIRYYQKNKIALEKGYLLRKVFDRRAMNCGTDIVCGCPYVNRN